MANVAFGFRVELIPLIFLCFVTVMPCLSSLHVDLEEKCLLSALAGASLPVLVSFSLPRHVCLCGRQEVSASYLYVIRVMILSQPPPRARKKS